MGTKATKFRIDFTKGIRTRAGSDVRIYEIFYERYLNGAYYSEDDDTWYVCQWDSQGMYASKPSSLDLVNV